MKLPEEVIEVDPFAFDLPERRKDGRIEAGTRNEEGRTSSRHLEHPLGGTPDRPPRGVGHYDGQPPGLLTSFSHGDQGEGLVEPTEDGIDIVHARRIPVGEHFLLDVDEVRENGIDPLVVGVFLGSIRVDPDVPNGEGEVVIDVGIDAEEGVLNDKTVTPEGPSEGDPPGVRYVSELAAFVGQEGPSVVVGKGDEIALHPLSIVESTGLQAVADLSGHSNVNREEDGTSVCTFPKEPLKGGESIFGVLDGVKWVGDHRGQRRLGRRDGFDSVVLPPKGEPGGTQVGCRQGAEEGTGCRHAGFDRTGGDSHRTVLEVPPLVRLDAWSRGTGTTPGVRRSDPGEFARWTDGSRPPGTRHGARRPSPKSECRNATVAFQSMTVRIGFLGHGFMGRAHANALDRLPRFFPDCPPVDRAVVIGLDLDDAQAGAERLGFDSATTDWREALQRIDLLCNLTPNHRHTEPAIAALERDVHVLCEKPLADSLEAADAMARAASESAASAGVVYNYRFVPAVQYAKELIARGDLGEIRHVRGHYLQDWMADPDVPWSWRTDAERAGTGALADIGSHLLDLARFLVGEVGRVSGDLRTIIPERPLIDRSGTREVDVDDAVTAQVRFENDATGIFEASRVAPGHKNELSIAIDGSRGSLRFDLERLNELEVYRDSGRGYETVLVTEESDPYVSAWWPPGHVLGWEHTFVHQYAEVLRAIAADRPFDPDFADGRETQAVLDAIERSAATEEWTTPV